MSLVSRQFTASMGFLIVGQSSSSPSRAELRGPRLRASSTYCSPTLGAQGLGLGLVWLWVPECGLRTFDLVASFAIVAGPTISSHNIRRPALQLAILTPARIKASHSRTRHRHGWPRQNFDQERHD